MCAGDRQYADSLRHVVPNVQLDLVVLGVGADGHTASLFPHSPALSADSHTLVTLTDRGPKDTPRRMTMTLPLINRYCGCGGWGGGWGVMMRVMVAVVVVVMMMMMTYPAAHQQVLWLEVWGWW